MARRPNVLSDRLNLVCILDLTGDRVGPMPESFTFGHWLFRIEQRRPERVVRQIVRQQALRAYRDVRPEKRWLPGGLTAR